MSQRLEYPEPLQELIRQLKRMPGVGPRSAERIALWLLTRNDAQPADIAAAIHAASAAVTPCDQCGFFSIEPRCRICSDPSRRQDLLCVVEQATDILPLERTGLFDGCYHSLGGRLSPLDHVTPEDLNIEPLLQRVSAGPCEEIILALSADVEGEATANYLTSLLKGSEVRITRLAQGISAGSGLESADELTLGKALSGRFSV